jgi:hypothetical protein
MIDILSFWKQGRKIKITPSGWVSGNAVCCDDKRGRGGIKVSENGWSYSCFNCQFTASFVMGRAVSFKTRRFLDMLGVSDGDIDQLNLNSLRHRSVYGIIDDRQRVSNAITDIQFDECDEFPPFSELVTSEHAAQWQYLRQRGVPEDYPVMTAIENDGVHWVRPQVIIPFMHHDQVVGWCARFLDNRQPRYINHSQPGYVFGTDLQRPAWQHVIVTEGIFDALSIGGLALMHNTVSDAQARLIRSLGREVTVVPDQDRAGMDLVDRAMELGWAVSMPEWPSGCKDVNDTVINSGKLATLISIMRARNISKIKIEIRKKQLIKNFKGKP